jgi:hypothetical protein
MLGLDYRKLSNSNGKGRRNSNEKREKALKSRQIVVVKSHPLGGARAVLFIEEVKGLVKMPSMPLTTYPANRVHGQRG